VRTMLIGIIMNLVLAGMASDVCAAREASAELSRPGSYHAARKPQSRETRSPVSRLPLQWRESSLQDFADGEIDPELYVSRRSELDPDSGCVEFSTYFDVNHDGYYDLIAADVLGPDIRVFLGSDSGYSPSRNLLYPVGRGGGALFADLNQDRNPELVHSGDSNQVSQVFWGTDSGPSPNTPTILSNHPMGEAIDVADLDHDGYPDIMVGCRVGSRELHIYWGGASGYSSTNQMTIMCPGDVVANIETADLNRDGWLDVILPTYSDSVVILYWGPNRTYRMVELPFPEQLQHGMSVADLNGDGWLDFICTAFGGSTQSYIYWGSASGFSTSQRTIIDIGGPVYGGSAVTDFNRDGKLDIVYFYGYGYRHKPRVYYNTGTFPYFDGQHYSDVGSIDIDADGGIAADLNFDSIPDLFVCSGATTDYVFYGPDYNRVDYLTTNVDHHGTFREPGNVYDRSLSAYYYSSVFDAGPGERMVSGMASWVGREPTGSRLLVAYRSGDTLKPDSTWRPFAEVPTNGGRIPDSCLGGRYLQYRVTFAYDRPNHLPELEAITANLSPVSNSSIDAGVVQILAPPSVVDSGTILVPKAVVRNYGTQPATFPVRFRIGSDYSAETTVTLATGASDTATFPSWVALPRGTLAVKCTTALVNDSNAWNNALTTSVTVRVRDVGATAILRPRGLTPDGDIVIPTAVVQNFGTTFESFDVVMRIANGYEDTAHVNALAPDSMRLVNFASWTATPGTHVIRCSTMLAADLVHANDMVVDSAQVIARHISVNPDTSGVVMPGGSISYLLRVSNLGSVADSIDVWSSGTRADWTVGLFDSSGQNPLTDHNSNGVPDVGEVAVGCTVRVLARLGAPAQEPGSVLDTTIVFGRSGVDSIQQDNARLYTRVAALPNLAISPDQNDSASPGRAVDYTCTVQNLGNISDLIDLDVVRTGADTGWRYEFLNPVELPLPDMNVNGMPDVGPLAPFTGTAQFLLRVTPPANAPQGECDTAQVWAISGTNPAVRQAITVYTTVLGQVTSLVVAPDQTDRVPGGTTHSYNLYVRLQGNMSDIVNLSVEGSNPDWTVQLYDASGQSLLSDHNSDGIPDVGSVAPGADEPFIVKVTSPTPNSGLIGNVDSLSTDFVKVVGRASTDRALVDTANLTILMVPILAIHNFQNPFRDQTRFVFGVPLDGRVSLVVYDRNGQVVRRLLEHVQYSAGVYNLPWDGRNDHNLKLAPGVYLYAFELESGDNQTERVNRKLMISSRQEQQ